MNVRQCRMARAALDWSQADLAKAASVSARSVIRYEAGEGLLPSRVQALQRALEQHGVVFVEGGPMDGAVVPPGAQHGR